MLEKYSLSVKLLGLACCFIFHISMVTLHIIIFETNGSKKNSKQNHPSSGIAFSQRFVKLFPTQLSGIPKWFFTINSSDLLHWSLNETYVVVTVSKMVRSELLIKVYLCPWRPAGVLCTYINLVTKFTHRCNSFCNRKWVGCDREINLWPLKLNIKYSECTSYAWL